MTTNTSKMETGLWRLHPAGEWEVRASESGLDLRAEEAAQVVATLCLLHMDAGTTVELRVGQGLMVCTVEEAGGVSVGWRARGGNPLVLSTMLQREELRSRGAASRAPQGTPPERRPGATRVRVNTLPEIPEVPGEAGSLEAETVARDEQASEGLVQAPDTETLEASEVIPPIVPIEGDSGSGWSRDRVTATVIELSERISGGGSGVQSVTLGDEESDVISFEIEFADDLSEADEVEFGVGERTRDSDPPSELGERVMCWVDFQRLVEQLTKMACQHVGARVTDNYWRQHLEEEPRLRGLVGHRRDEGVIFLEPGAVVSNEEAAWLLGVVDRWLDRCERVLPEEAAYWRRFVAEELDNFWLETKELT